MFLPVGVNTLLVIDYVLVIALLLAIAGVACWELLRRRAGRVRVARWLDVALYAVIGGMLIVLVGPWVTSRLSSLFKQGDLPPGGQVALAILLGALLLAMIRARAPSVGRWGKTLLLFPPWWVAVLGAPVVSFVYWVLDSSIRSSLLPPGDDLVPPIAVVLATWLGMILLISSLVVWHRVRARELQAERKAQASDNDGSEIASPPRQPTSRLPSAFHDRPIERPEEDLFGHDAIAQRIARRLTSSEGASSIALIGGFGSGKSSVRNLTIHALKDEPSILIVPVSAWPFESASALVTGILERVVDELAKTAGWEALRHVPSRYREAIEGSAEGWGKLLRILERSRTPQDILREVDDVAIALGMRVVVWVEDLERYAPLPDDQSETPESREKLEPVRALLHQLQELQNVTIVVATTRLSIAPDLEKLVRFIEKIPSLQPERALKLLEDARQDAVDLMSSYGFIDPYVPEERAKLDLAPQGVTRLVRQLPVLNPTWVEALVVMCSTPRTIKQGLRHFREIWEHLVGEIDVDHALTASILAHAEIGLFHEIDAKYSYLRLVEDREKQRVWEGIVENANVGGGRRSAAISLLDHMFGSRARMRPQGFARERPVDYWERFIASRPIDGPARDQWLLSAMRSFQSRASEELIELSMNEWVAARVEAFGALFSLEDLVRLFDAQLTWARRRRVPWPDPNNPPGLSETLTMCRRAVDKANGAKEVDDRFFGLISRHLQNALDAGVLRIADWLLLRMDAAELRLVSEEQCSALRQQMISGLVETFSDNPARLAAALKDEEPWRFHRICVGIRRMRTPDDELPFPEWLRIAPTVEEAARLYPYIVLPQLAHFLATAEWDEGVAYAATVRELRISRLFPGSDVLSLFGAHPGVTSADRATQARLNALRAAALARKS